jgi:hypothetical protein
MLDYLPHEAKIDAEVVVDELVAHPRQSAARGCLGGQT